ncbi:MAG: oligosaccharide flippase family protein [Anaerolineae bacterium]|jgi:O-antigen/teichoic acid export membrane protein
MSIAERTVHSTAYNATASIIQTVIQFLRTIILARLLEPNVFGIYAFASSWIIATRSFGEFGMTGALLHRAEQSEGEIAIRVHFTLSLLFSLGWALALAGLTPWLVPQTMSDETLWVFWVLIVAEAVTQNASTARAVLTRRVVFRRISLVNTVTTLVATVVTLVLAWLGFGVWCLVASDIVRAILTNAGYYLYRPVWRPRLAWSTPVVRYFIGFGRKTFMASLLRQALDRVDDLWTGNFLGETPLGFYSRAYRFATYPRSILAEPLSAVTGGTYAELKSQPRRLSAAFFRINSFLVRTGFLLAGLLALAAPEFIRIVIGAKWLPMLTAFRLMLIFTLLDPIKATIANLFTAVGHPEKTVWTRTVQLVALVLGLFLLGPRWGIAGVALAVDVMLIVGIGLLLWQAREYVRFSVRRMFLVPTLALALGMAGGRAAIMIPGILGSPWRTGAMKVVVFSVVYAVVLLLLERDQIPMLLRILGQLRSRIQISEAAK